MIHLRSEIWLVVGRKWDPQSGNQMKMPPFWRVRWGMCISVSPQRAQQTKRSPAGTVTKQRFWSLSYFSILPRGTRKFSQTDGSRGRSTTTQDSFSGFRMVDQNPSFQNHSLDQPFVLRPTGNCGRPAQFYKWLSPVNKPTTMEGKQRYGKFKRHLCLV